MCRQKILPGTKDYCNNKRDYLYRLRDINHYWVCDYEYDKRRNNQEIPDLCVFTTNKDRNLVREYKTFVQSRHRINHASSNEHNPNGFYSYIINNKGDGAFPQNSDFNIDEFNNYLDRFERRSE